MFKILPFDSEMIQAGLCELTKKLRGQSERVSSSRNTLVLLSFLEI